MFAVELSAPIDNNISTVYIGNYTDTGIALTVNVIVEKSPYREEYIPLWSGAIYAQMQGYTELDIARSVRQYYANGRNLVEPSYSLNTESDWDSFNAYILSDAAFNQTMGSVMQNAPAVAVAIPAALSQVAANGVTAFALAFNAFCTVGQVTTQQRETWADIAESFNLPSDFVAVVRG